MGSRDPETVDALLDSLATRRRRLILSHVLNAEGEWVGFEDLVDVVIEAERHSQDPDRESVAASLHHRNLPKLAETDLVTYDSESRSITATEKTGLVEPCLELARSWTGETDTRD